jgi:hypothetical protein
MKEAHFTVMAEIDASDLFADQNINWEYCNDHSSFIHRDEDACEYILHVGSDEDGDVVKDTVGEMTEYGCTPAFIEAYRELARAGAVRVLFYV